MRKLTLIIVTVVFLIFTACNENKLEVENKSCKAYTDLNFSNYDSLKSDPINVASIEVVGDCLQMKVTYGGYTNDHPIDLAYMHPWCGTPPIPPPTFEIKHDSRGELCKMLVTNNLSFDLSPLRTDRANEVLFTVFWHTEGDSVKSIDLKYKY